MAESIEDEVNNCITDSMAYCQHCKGQFHLTTSITDIVSKKNVSKMVPTSCLWESGICLYSYKKFVVCITHAGILGFLLWMDAVEKTGS